KPTRLGAKRGRGRRQSWAFSFQAALGASASGSSSLSSSAKRPRSAFSASKLRPRTSVAASLVLERKKAAERFQRLEVATADERCGDALKPCGQLGRAIGAKRRFDQRTGERRGANGGRRVHQHDLHREIDLADEGCRRIRLHHVVLE